MEPHIVSRVTNHNGAQVARYIPQLATSLMSAGEAALLRQMMEQVVQSGTGTALAGASFQVAGKTGSAQYSDLDANAHHSWFIGYSGREETDLAFAIIIESAGNVPGARADQVLRRILDAYYQ